MFYGEAPHNDPVIKGPAAETGHNFPVLIEKPDLPRARFQVQLRVDVLSARFGRDRHNYAKTWSDDPEAYAAKSLRNDTARSTVLGVEANIIDQLASADRADAYKMMIGIKINGGWTVENDYDYQTDADWINDPANAAYLAGSLEGSNHLWDKLGIL